MLCLIHSDWKVISLNIEVFDQAQILKLLPDRDPYGHKGSFGKVLLLCGSKGFTGAAYLAAMGALRTGAGLVFLGVPESIYAIEATKLNEPVVFSLPDEDGTLRKDASADILKRLPQMDAVLIGCGLGQSEGTLEVVKTVLQHAACPVVIDADGINVLKQHKHLLRGRTYPTIITPHDGEFLRFGGELGNNRMESAARFSREWNSIVLLKGHRTCITDGDRGFINHTGNPGMAVGGSGDILAGMIVSLLGQGIPPLEASACAAWLHGAAGDLCAQEIGQYGMLPTDLLIRIPRFMK